MTVWIAGPRARAARIVLVAVAVALAAAIVAVLARSDPAAATRRAAASETILTLRSSGDHDAMWLVSNEGTATAVGMLPGLAESVAASPGGSTVAYLPVLGKPEIWIGYGPDGVRTIDLRPAGIKTVTDMTWTSETQLLISGSRKAGDAAGYSDRLYTVDVATGAVASFRNLIGTEPSASPDSGKIVYVKFRKLDNGPKNNGQAPKYRESLMLATLTGTGSSQTLDSDEYRLTADYHAFADPQIAPGGAWIAYGTTGSDVSVTYTVICLGDEYYVPWLKMWMPTPLAMAWAPAGPLLALGGAAVGPEEDQDAGMYVMDAAGGTTDRTTRDLFTKDSIEWVMDMDWSLDGKIVADGMPKDFDATEEFRVLLIDGHDLTRLTDLGEGHLSVWVK